MQPPIKPHVAGLFNATKLIRFLVLIFALPFSMHAIPLDSGTYCVGPSASYNSPTGGVYQNASVPYSTLTAALSAITTQGASGPVVFELQNDYTGAGESIPISINYQGTATNTLLIRVRNDLTTPILFSQNYFQSAVIGIFDFNSAKHVTLDGSMNNASCNGNYGLIIRNTAIQCSAISFENDAQHNTVRGLQVDISQGGQGVFLENFGGIQGNYDNHFECCKFQASQSNYNPNSQYTGIATRNSSSFSVKNEGIYIHQNHFLNCYTGIAANGNGNRGYWEIVGNHFYKNTGHSGYGGAIQLQMTDTCTLYVTGNYIGGSEPFAGGSKMLLNGSGNFVLLSGPYNSPQVSVFSNNIFRNIEENFSIQLLTCSNLPMAIEGNLAGSVSQTNSITAAGGFGFINYLRNNSIGHSIYVQNNELNNVSVPVYSPGSFFRFISFGCNFPQLKYFNNNSCRNITTACPNFSGIEVGATNQGGSGGTFNNNVLEHIHQTTSVTNSSVFMKITADNMTVTGNRIGDENIPNDISISNVCSYLLQITSNTGTGSVDSNTFANIHLNNTGDNTTTILKLSFLTGNSPVSISKNKILNVVSKTSHNDDINNYAVSALHGISFTSNAAVNIKGNTISGLSVQPTGNSWPGIHGIVSNTSAVVNISENVIRDFTNFGSGGSGTPFIVGIHYANGQVELFNNMVSLSNQGNGNNLVMVGIRQVNGFNKFIYHNTVSISGTNGGVAKSYAFYKALSNATSNDQIKNNIFINSRSGSGKHFAIGSEISNSNFWGTSDYNDLYTSNASTLGEWPIGTDRTFSNWKSASSNDAHSKNVPVSFLQIDGDLHLSTSSNCAIDSSGTNVSISKDLDGQNRNINFPDMGADEFSNTLYIDAGSDINICDDSMQLNGLKDAGSTGYWTCSGCSFSPDSSHANALVHDLILGNNSLVWHVQNGTCATTDDLNISRTTDHVTVNTNYTSIVCPGTPIQLNLPYPLRTGMWLQGDTVQNLTVYPTQTTTYSINALDVRGCIVDTGITVQVYSLPPLSAAAPALPFNKNGQVIIPLQFSWSPAVNANGVEFFLWRKEMPRPLNGFTTPNTISLTTDTLLPNQEYYWQLKSNNICQAIYSDTFSFITNFPDLKADQLSTLNSVYQSTPISVSWTIKNSAVTANTGSLTWRDKILLSTDSILDLNDVELGNYENQSYLNAGQTYSQQRIVSPVNLTGNFFLFIQTDYLSQVPEIQESNNSRFVPITILPVPVPDLTVMSAAHAGSAFSGDSITVTYQIKNQGQSSTPAQQWDDEFFLSTLPVFNIDSCISLSEFKSGNIIQHPVYYYHPTIGQYVDHYTAEVVALQIDSSYTLQKKIRMPLNLWTNNYYLYVKTNSGNMINEGAYGSNNVYKSPSQINITQQPPSDFVVDTLIAPITAASGQPITLQWTVKNNGSPNTYFTHWTDEIWYNTSNSITGATLLASKSGQGVLSQSQTYTNSMTVNLPIQLTGNYYFFVKTDAANSVFEYLFDNNNSKGSNHSTLVNMSPTPDLTIESSSFANATVTPGTMVSLQGRIKNLGTASTQGAWKTVVRYSKNIQYNANDPTANSFEQLSPLAAGDSISKTLSFQAPSDTGTYYYFITLDNEDSQYEYNGENNNQSQPIQLDCIPPPATSSDLQASILQFQNSTFSGENYLVSYQVVNAGPQLTSALTWKDKIYLSTDSVLDANDIFLAEKELNGQLTLNGSYTNQASILIPNGTLSDSYYILVQSDAYGNNLNETNPMNNIAKAIFLNTLLPAPDLEIISVNIPDTLYAKQQCSISCIVKNNGPGMILNKGISERGFMEDNSTSFNNYIGGINLVRSISVGNTDTVSFLIDVPPYANGYNFVNIKTDFYNGIYEGFNENNNVISKAVYVKQLSEVDLLPITLDFPNDTVQLGDKIDLTYSVKNIGSQSLLAISRNTISFSNSTKNQLLNFSDNSTLIAPGDTANFTMQTTVKEVMPNQYAGTLKINSRNTYPESNNANNILNTDSIQVTIQELLLNTITTTYLSADEYLYYKLSVPPNLDLAIGVNQVSGAGNNIVLSSLNQMPTETDAQYIGQNVATPNQTLLLPATSSGTYYILIKNTVPSIDSQLLEIKATPMPLAILSIQNNRGGKGKITTSITGAGFKDSSTVQLVQGETVVATGTISKFIHTMKMDVQWDLTLVPEGIYSVEVINGGDTVSLENAFTVEQPDALNAEISMTPKGNSVIGTSYIMNYEFTNTSNLDIPIIEFNFILSKDCPMKFSKPAHSIWKNSLDGISNPLIDVEGYKVLKGYIYGLRSGGTSNLTITLNIEVEGVNPIEHAIQLFSLTEEQLAKELVINLEPKRQESMRYVLEHYPNLTPVLTQKNEFFAMACSAYIDSGLVSRAVLDTVINRLPDNYIDFNPGTNIGTYIDEDIEFRKGDVYRWEINVPDYSLGAQEGKTIGWDLIHALHDIVISADSTDPFRITLIPRNPITHDYTQLTTWEAWHDYHWPIAVADDAIIGFDASKFDINTYLFAPLNELYGGHFELSVSGDTLYLNFIHKTLLPGDMACNGGPGIGGFPGGRGGPGVGNGRGGDGGSGFGIGSKGGNGGNGAGGGGAGGGALTSTDFGQPGVDTDLDNDGDGILDTLDNCPNNYNPFQADIDNDGIGDECDAHIGVADADSDDDGIPDGVDNSLLPNPSQADADQDGIGDISDQDPFGDDGYKNIPKTAGPFPLDCPNGFGCPPCQSCFGSGGNSGNTASGKTKKSGLQLCQEILEDAGCKVGNIVNCVGQIWEQIKVNGGDFNQYTTTGAKNRDLLGQIRSCGEDEIISCIDRVVPGFACAAATFDAGKSLLELEMDIDNLNSAYNDVEGAKDACIPKETLKQLCGIITKSGSHDPNEILGPEGVGDTTIRWIAKNKTHDYTIFFENDSLLGTATAKRVVINHSVPTHMDALTFRLGSIHFGQFHFELPANAASYTGILNTHDSLGYDVEITAGLNYQANNLFWILQAVDPITGLAPTTVLGGFLPVNDSDGRGQGYVTYSIQAEDSVQTGDTVRAQAAIVFDINEPIATNIWNNLLDAGNPLSNIDSLPVFVQSDSLDIHVTASDELGGSGLSYVELYYQINGGTFQWYNNIADTTSILFRGIEGNIYGFYTIAVDSCGNKEFQKTQAQWTVQFGYKDSINIINPLSNTSICELTNIPIQWTKYKVDSIKLNLLNTEGEVLFSSGTFSTSDSNYSYILPVLNDDTVKIQLTDIENQNVFDLITILVDHKIPWYSDQDGDGYYSGTAIISCASPANGYTAQIIAGGDCNDADSSIHPGGIELCCNSIDENCNGLMNEANIYLKLYLQGYYLGAGLMSNALMNQGVGAGTSIVDSVELELHNDSTFDFVASYKTTMNSDGTVLFGIPNYLEGFYYLVLKHRNSIQVWTPNPILLTYNTTYDFTTSSLQAYGENMVEVELDQWALYSGDINQDGVVDGLDYNEWELDNNNFAAGYFSSDLNGDGIVDGLDFLLWEVNNNNFVGVVSP